MEWTTEVGCAYTASFALGSTGSTRDVTIQLKDFAGNNLTVKNVILVYYSTDPAADAGETLGATTVLATHGIIETLEDKKFELLITEDNGIVAITVDGDSAVSIYVNVILPNGKVVTSQIVEFTG